jgi:hypothetical protein
VLESPGAATGPAERDVLEGLPNEEASWLTHVVCLFCAFAGDAPDHSQQAVC